VSVPSGNCVIDVAHPTALLRHAGKTVLVASAVPSALFYFTLSLAGLPAAIGAALGWYYTVLVARHVRKRPVVGAAMLGAGLMSMRAVVALWTGSAYLYFLQPVAGTVATATSIAVTAMAGRPLIERLLHDFVPVPEPLSERLHRARFFHRTSALWTLTYVVNAVGTVWLLTNASLGSFVLIKSFMSPVLTSCAATVTFLLFRRLLRREGVSLRWAPAAQGVHAGRYAATSFADTVPAGSSA
jgi:hypothetical protein